METHTCESYLLYDGDYSKIKRIDDLGCRVKINYICMTPTIKDAAKLVGVSIRHMFDFIKEAGITTDDIEEMRFDYKRRRITKILKRI